MKEPTGYLLSKFLINKDKFFQALAKKMINKKPLVSICCTTYNLEKYIKAALDGFLTQKGNLIDEIIIYDDASSDNTVKIIREYAKKYPNLIFPIFQKENQYTKGIQPMVDIIFPKTRGKYIALCDGDDYWTDPYKIQKQVNFLEKNKDCAGCFHHTQTIYEKDGKKGKIYGKNDDKLFLTSEDTISILSLMATSSYVFRRESLVIPKDFYRGVSYDMAVCSLIAAKGKWGCIPEIMSVYRKHEKNVTSDVSVNKNYHKERIQLIGYLNKYHEFRYDKKAKKVIEYHKSKQFFLNRIKRKIKFIIFTLKRLVKNVI